MNTKMSVHEAITIIKNIVVTTTEETAWQVLKTAALANQAKNSKKDKKCTRPADYEKCHALNGDECMNAFLCG